MGPKSVHLETSENAGGELDVLSTGDMARFANTTLRTVRFYEEAGILKVTRTDGGHRIFARGELDKLRLAVDLREAGFSLHDIRALFELKGTCATATEASQRVSEALGSQMADMQRKIALLRKLRDELASTTEVLKECRTCSSGGFPSGCSNCDVMARTDLPRATRVLWNL